MREHCSFEGCWGEVIARNRQAILLGKDEVSQQYLPAVYKRPGLGDDWVAVENLKQEPELVLASSADLVPQPLYKQSKLHTARWMGWEDEW